MIEVEDAVKLLLAHTKTQEKIKEVDILDSLNCILAEDVISSISVPSYSKAAMDGYALKSIETLGASKNVPKQFNVIGKVLAGDDKQFKVLEGTTVRIMTGAPIPEKYDCVIRQEDTDYDKDFVNIYKELKPFENYSLEAEDIKIGQKLIDKHTQITAYHIPILASLGIAKIKILEPPKVGIISTGAELLVPGEPLKPAKIYNSCGYSLSAILKSLGITVEFMEICKDDPKELSCLIQENIDKVDFLITTGGVSVGEKDIVPGTFEDLAAKLLFKKVNMKPGTHILANYYKEKIVLNLSGNPFAALANFHIFFWPLIEKFMSNQYFGNKEEQLVVKEGYMKAGGLRRFVRAFADKNFVSIYTTNHKSSTFSNMIEANCLLEQPPNCEIKKGDTVKVIYLK